MVQKYFLSNR